MSERDQVTIAMAVQPSMADSYINTVYELLPYCDRFCICFNGFKELPKNLPQSSKILTKITDENEFAWYGEFEGYFLIVSDRFDYGPKYVETVVAKLKSYSNKAVVACQGTVFTQMKDGKPDFTSQRKTYTSDKIVKDVECHLIDSHSCGLHQPTIVLQRDTIAKVIDLNNLTFSSSDNSQIKQLCVMLVNGALVTRKDAQTKSLAPFDKRSITVDELFSHSLVISISKERYLLFNKIFEKSFGVIPQLISGVTDFGDNVRNCLESHRKCIQHAKNHDWPYVLVFEDDAYPCINCSSMLNTYLQNIPNDAGIVLLGWSSYNNKNQSFDEYINHISCTFAGAHSYIVFKDAYDLYLSYVDNHKNGTADGFIFNRIQEPYVVNQSLFIQYCSKQSMNKHFGYIHNDPKCNSRCMNSPTPPKNFQSIYEILSNKAQPQEIWIFMDRRDRADDNAEHLYRYVSNNFKHILPYFCIDKTSIDWNRLKSEKFNLVDYSNRKEVISLLQRAKYAVGSQFYLFKLAQTNRLKNIKCIFLQHGICLTNLSKYFSQVSNLDIITTTVDGEYRSFIDKNSKYNFDQSKVKLVGLARHDRLSSMNLEIPTEKRILFQFTWRNNIVSEAQFKHSLYYKTITALLSNDKLKSICDRYGYTITINAHPNMQKFSKFFKLPSYVQIIQSTNFQSIFSKSALLITDYSSVSFEMAYLNKPIIYYQFDQDTMLDEKHSNGMSWRKGWFNFNKDGLGPVTKTLNDTIKYIKHVLSNNCIIDRVYQQRIDKFFKFRDQNNCRRIYDAIKELK